MNLLEACTYLPDDVGRLQCAYRVDVLLYGAVVVAFAETIMSCHTHLLVTADYSEDIIHSGLRRSEMTMGETS